MSNGLKSVAHRLEMSALKSPSPWGAMEQTDLSGATPVGLVLIYEES